MLMQTDVPKAIDQVNQLPQVIEERLVCCLVFLHQLKYYDYLNITSNNLIL